MRGERGVGSERETRTNRERKKDDWKRKEKEEVRAEEMKGLYKTH